MKLQSPQNFRALLAKKYLDWAEKLPRFQGGWIADLQVHREFQRKHSVELHKRTRPPEKTELQYLYIRIFDIFNIEDFQDLYQGLRRLFSGVEKDFRHRDFLSDYKEFSERISAGGWKRIGIIRPEGKANVHLFPIRIVPGLPTEIEEIRINLHKVLPSILMLTMDVILNNHATRHLKQLQERVYLPQVQFSGIIPWRRYGWKESPAELVMNSAIQGWQDSLRSSVETSLRPFLNGYFMHRSSRRLPRLPTIEVYGLQGVPQESEAFDKWKSETIGWLRSHGLILAYDTYGNEKLLFRLYKDDRSQGITPHFLVVLWEPYLRLSNREGFGNDPRAVIEHYTEYTLNSITSGSFMLFYLESLQNEIENLRSGAFNRIEHPFSRFRLLNNHRFYSSVQKNSMLLDRLRMEFEQREDWIIGDMHEAQDLKEVAPPKPREGKDLRETILSFAKWQLEVLGKHLTLVENSFSEYLRMENIEVMYRLQRGMLWLTRVIAIATIIGVMAEWDNIRKLFNNLLSAVSSAY